MADTWLVTATGVSKNGVAVAHYVAHYVWLRNNTESNAFVEVGLIVVVDDQTSETQRTAQTAVLPTAIKNTLTAENNLRPTTRRIKPQIGDTIQFSGITDQVLAASQGSAGISPGDPGGVMPI